MSVRWTSEQQQVIDLKDRDILVSAAAGSGKTAVLVERIIKKITDEVHPVDIDRLLVVTFTNAAAAEMRERIRLAIGELLEQEPENENLMRQASLIHHAQITTIDSFCLHIVRNHFGEIGIEPNFRIADSGELELIRIDTLKEVFEAEYEACRNVEDSDFLRLIDAYSGKRSDAAVKDMVAKICRLAESQPWKREWMLSLCDIYRVKNKEELCRMPLTLDICAYVRLVAADCIARTKELLSLALAPDGPAKYAAALEADLKLYEEAEKQTDYAGFYEILSSWKYQSLAAIRGFDGDEGKKLAVSEGRRELKAVIEDIKEKYFAVPPESTAACAARLLPYAKELVRLACLFDEAFAAKKRKKRIVDFSDIEHFALQILVDEQTKACTATALELQQQFAEVMIDEYQDSNQVQEAILCAVAKNGSGGHNMFMVGDVKQSIYRFRMACPQLFMEKYRTFDAAESITQKIDLHKNFRSRREVLNFSNDMFYKLMGEDLGDVGYDDDAALYPGAEYPKNPDMKAEVLYFDLSGDAAGDAFDEEASKQQLEARMVADKIEALMQSLKVTDKKTGEQRPLRYRDIVILLRSVRGWGDAFAAVLKGAGIPAHVESQTGYFSAVEVQVVLNMLRILDNPYQDIPMAAVLHSPMAGLLDEELAEIRVSDESVPFSAAAKQCMEQAYRRRESGETLGGPAEKLAAFYEVYRRLRRDKDIPIRDLIYRVLKETGYGEYAAALPAGAQRAANLSMLLEKASAYEKTSYKGLFHFIRYIDRINQYAIDEGEADVIGENADAVRIMTIHKSKGLEFPVVFVSGLSKQFHLRETSEMMVLSAESGMGLMERKAAPKIKRRSLFQTQIAERMKREAVGEELRVLYVALTRAKEKLILTGTVAAERISAYTGNCMEKQPLPFLTRAGAKCYTDWVIPAVLSYPDKYELTLVTAEELVRRSIEEQTAQAEKLEELFARAGAADEALAEQIKKELSYVYPYAGQLNRKSKYSVSELKHASMAERYDAAAGEAERPAFLAEEKEHYIPRFAGQKEKEKGGGAASYGVSGGALFGTAVHRVMECLDFAGLAKVDRKDAAAVESFVQKELARMRETNGLTADMGALIIPSMVAEFAKSDIASRMAAAASRGRLYKEKPFVMEHDGVLVQGIIDVFWEEDGALVVLDYKTDRVSTGEELALRYKTQLRLYADALTRIFSTENKTWSAKECLLYSFRLKEVVQV